MKPWQHGYEIDYLKGIESDFKAHNEQMISPFLEMKKNKIASYLKDQSMVLKEGFRFAQKEIKRDSQIKVYGPRKDYILAVMSKGGVQIISPVIEDIKAFEDYLDLLDTDVWIQASEKEAEKIERSVKDLERVGVKYSSFGDSIVVFKRGSSKSDADIFGILSDPQKPACLYTDPLERSTALHLSSFHFDVQSLREKIESVEFSAHYSNYNDGGWGAVSLRGYSDDPMFITKPSEMSDAWKEKNPEMINAGLRDTEFYDHFKEAREIVEAVALGAKVHRVRLMRLEQGAVIGRHTDLVDEDAGVQLGKLPRFHVPIISEDCVFEVWGMDGKETHRMEPGSLWYLDTRKPHSVTNKGRDRIHLVFDLEADERLIEMMKKEIGR